MSTTAPTTNETSIPGHAAVPPMLDHVVTGRRAWRAGDLTPAHWRIALDQACLDEIETLLDTLRCNPLATELLTPADYPMPACERLMRRVKAVLDDGVGFAAIGRLPVELHDKDEMKAVYWLLSAMIARPVAQSFTGTMLYDVIDMGLLKSEKVRADKTREELSLHTDYGYNEPPPYIGLQVLATARAGGENTAVSLLSVHNEMLRRHPRALERLYRPFHLNRYGEHAPDDAPTSCHPVFAWDGTRLKTRFNLRNALAGSQMAGMPLDEPAQEALALLSTVLEDPGLVTHFTLVAGEILYLNNWSCAHSRTAYEDHAEPERRRHLVRIFLRDSGRRSYHG